MPARRGRLRVLHVLLSIGETSAPYNEHCLAAVHERDIGICTYFSSRVILPHAITLFEGDGSRTGFVRALSAALASRAWDIIHVHAPQAALVLLAARLWERRARWASSVYTVHNSFHNYKVRNRLLLIPIFLCFPRVVCCSRVAHDSFPRLFRRLAGSRLSVVQNGVDIDRVDHVVATLPGGARDGTFTLTSVGQLIERKDPQCVLDAFAAADDGESRLVFVGEGHLRAPLAAQIRARGLAQRIELTGLVPRETVYEHMSRTHLFVSASRGEGLPVAVLEAMACRCPVMLSDIPPHREIAAGADFIPLIRPGDVDALAREVKNFRGMSPADRMAIGQKCRKLAEGRFSLRAMHAGYEAVYTHALDRHGETPLRLPISRRRR
jgi:glycosyltransferase involved in cell wall biosynthesis